MKEKPILFTGEMVRAILEGRKTQTRRIMKPQPAEAFLKRGLVSAVPQWPMQNGVRFFMADGFSELVSCPYGQPLGRLWVRETHAFIGCEKDSPDAFEGAAHGIYDKDGMYEYFSTKFAADNPEMNWDGGWRPSIFVPRWASRITLEITKVRVERLQEITDYDAQWEGVKPSTTVWIGKGHAKACYADLWESINGKGSWDLNPWVWVIEFKIASDSGPMTKAQRISQQDKL